MAGGWSDTPSFSRKFLGHCKTPFNKKVLVPLREQGQKDNFCGTTLFAVKTATSVRCQHTGCPLTLAMRQKILWFPISPCPQRPICCPAFRFPLSYGKLSVDALAVLLPLLRFIYVEMVILQFCPFVKHKNTRLAEISTCRGTAFCAGKNSKSADIQPSDTS